MTRNSADSAKRFRLVLVDGDAAYRTAAGKRLAAHGIRVLGLSSGAALMNHFAGVDSGDIVALDWKLPDGNGIDFMARLLNCGVRVPAIFLTARATLANEHLAFERGAVDFVEKSRGMAILAQRLRLVLCAGKQVRAAPREEIVQIGDLRLRLDACRAYWKDIDVGLTVTEFRIVKLLTTKGEFVRPREIYDNMHYVGFVGGTGADGYRNNVRAAVMRIRNKFRSLDSTFEQIATLPCLGYRWGGLITESVPPSAAARGTITYAPKDGARPISPVHQPSLVQSRPGGERKIGTEARLAD